VVGMDVAEMAAAGRAVDRAMVLGIEKVDHADRENDGQPERCDSFHPGQIIPYRKEGVKPLIL
jgi:hypothetical protein